MLAATRSAQTHSDGSAVPNCSNAAPGSAAGNPRNSRCPKTFDALLEWLKGRWAEEPFPERMHRRGVYDGSALGTPAEDQAFRRHVESPGATDKDGYYLTPLHCALDYMGHRHPLTAAHIWAVVRLDGDWRSIADRGGWPHEMYSKFLDKGLEELFFLYRMAPC